MRLLFQMAITLMLNQRKQAYDQAVQHANDLINGTNQPTINKGDISRASQTVNTTKDALDGNHRLEAAQQNATQTITNLSNLNNAQKMLKNI